jgi:hypothetical protein
MRSDLGRGGEVAFGVHRPIHYDPGVRQLAFFVLLCSLVACDAPADALVQTCSYNGLSRVVRCTIVGASLTKNHSAWLDPRSKNLKARVTGSFSVKQGKVAIVFLGCAEHARVDVVPGKAVPVACDSEVSRNSHSFPLEAFVFGERAEGLEGQLEITPL